MSEVCDVFFISVLFCVKCFLSSRKKAELLVFSVGRGSRLHAGKTEEALKLKSSGCAREFIAAPTSSRLANKQHTQMEWETALFTFSFGRYTRHSILWAFQVLLLRLSCHFQCINVDSQLADTFVDLPTLSWVVVWSREYPVTIHAFWWRRKDICVRCWFDVNKVAENIKVF